MKLLSPSKLHFIPFLFKQHCFFPFLPFYVYNVKPQNTVWIGNSFSCSTLIKYVFSFPSVKRKTDSGCHRVVITTCTPTQNINYNALELKSTEAVFEIEIMYIGPLSLGFISSLKWQWQWIYYSDDSGFLPFSFIIVTVYRYVIRLLLQRQICCYCR